MTVCWCDSQQRNIKNGRRRYQCDRIEALKNRYAEIERGLMKVNRMEGMLERALHRRARRGSGEFSPDEASASNDSSDDLHLARSNKDELEPRCREDR